MCTPRNLKFFIFFTAAPSMWIGVCSLCCFHNHALRFVDVEVIFLALLRQGPHLLPVGCLIIVGNLSYNCCVLYANLMIELEAYVAKQSWVSRKYRRGLSVHPCGAPVLRISEAELLFLRSPPGGGPSGSPGPSCPGRGSDPGPQALMSLEGTMVLKAEL
jgi:hypothetical protein